MLAVFILGYLKEILIRRVLVDCCDRPEPGRGIARRIIITTDPLDKGTRKMNRHIIIMNEVHLSWSKYILRLRKD